MIGVAGDVWGNSAMSQEMLPITIPSTSRISMLNTISIAGRRNWRTGDCSAADETVASCKGRGVTGSVGKGVVGCSSSGKEEIIVCGIGVLVSLPLIAFISAAIVNSFQNLSTEA